MGRSKNDKENKCNNYNTTTTLVHSPAQHTENKVHDEEGSEHNHGNEVEKLPCVAHGILDLHLQEWQSKINVLKEST